MEKVEREEIADHFEGPRWLLIIFIFTTTEEILRHFTTSQTIRHFVICFIAFSIGRFTSKRSEGLAKDALGSVLIVAASFLSLEIVSPFLNNYMNAYLAYGLPGFLFPFMIWAWRRALKKESGSFTRVLVLALIVGTIFALVGNFFFK